MGYVYYGIFHLVQPFTATTASGKKELFYDRINDPLRDQVHQKLGTTQPAVFL